MIRKRNAAIGTLRNISAASARNKSGKSAPVHKQNRLFFIIYILLNFIQKNIGKHTSVASRKLAPHINNVYFGQYRLIKTFFHLNKLVISDFRIVIAFN